MLLIWISLLLYYFDVLYIHTLYMICGISTIVCMYLHLIYDVIYTSRFGTTVALFTRA